MKGRWVVVERKQAAQAYVVQQVDESGFWRDIATVTVPARSKRRTIIAAALSSAEVGRAQFPATLRVLDADAAREHRVELRQPEPELVIE